MESYEDKALRNAMKPYLMAGAAATVLIVMALLVLLKLTGSLQAHVSVVTFDVIKYTNSQRAVASAFLKPGSNTTQASELLLNISERTRAAIEKVAGKNTLIVLKQAVVQGQGRDITDEVLQELGLPLQVPTVNSAEYAIDSAPALLIPQAVSEETKAQPKQQVLP